MSEPGDCRTPIHIPNGAPLREIRFAKKICTWGVKPSDYVLFLGRFSPQKNCHLLIEAFARLDTKLDLVLAGSSSHYSKTLRRQARPNVRFLDYVSGDVFEGLLTNAMLVVLPSDLEGLSLALLEAMGAGVCVLASNFPENREVIEGAGFSVPTRGRRRSRVQASVLDIRCYRPQIRGATGGENEFEPRTSGMKL